MVPIRVLALLLLAACSPTDGAGEADAGRASRVDAAVDTSHDTDADCAPATLVAPGEDLRRRPAEAPADNSLLGRHPLRIGDLAWSPDGSQVATCEIGDVMPRGGVTLWDAHTLEPSRRLFPLPDPDDRLGPFEWESCAVDWSPDGRWLVEARITRDEIRLWDVHDEGGRMAWTLDLDGVRGVAFSPDGRTLAALTFVRRAPRIAPRAAVRLVEVATGRLDERPRRIARPTARIWWSADGSTLLGPGRRSGLVRRLVTGLAAPGERRGEPTVPVHARTYLAPTGEQERSKARSKRSRADATRRHLRALAVGSADGGWRATLHGPTVRLVRVDGSIEHRLDLDPVGWSPQAALAFSPSGEVLATTLSAALGTVPNELTSRVRLWNVETGAPLGAGNQPTCREASLAPAEGSPAR